MVKSLSYNEQEIIQSILSLHCAGKIDLDPTYSKGGFYKNWQESEKPTHKFDLYPQSTDVKQANAAALPFESASLKTIMFDPPFLATTGKSLLIGNESNKINKRFTVFHSEKALHQFYIDAMQEFYRILSEKGILIFKCQDKVSSGKQYFSHVFIMQQAEKMGYYCKDLFVLAAKNRIVADWQLKNQKHARKFHSYFLVFEKSSKRPVYL